MAATCPSPNGSETTHDHPDEAPGAVLDAPAVGAGGARPGDQRVCGTATQLQADYLKADRGYSALWVTLFIIITNTPAGLGVVLGGRWGDSWGRKPVAAIGMVECRAPPRCSCSPGASMWVASLLSAVIGGLSVATIGVYGRRCSAAAGLAGGLLLASPGATGLVGSSCQNIG
ncbi:MAG: hypothetical protein R2704_17465 [Microthrixaceae bacterium]